MNKKGLILLAIPALLLSGCSNNKAISKEQAIDVATKIAEKQSISNANITELSLVTEQSSKVTSKTNYEHISTYTSSYYKVNAFEYVAEAKYLYMYSRTNGLTSSATTTKNWAFIQDGYFYFLQEATKKEGYKFQVPDGKDLFGCLSVLFQETINIGYFLKNTELSTFDAGLNLIKAGKDFQSEFEDEETKPSTVTNVAKYYSNNADHLMVDFTSTLANTAISYMGLNGQASGMTGFNMSWEEAQQAAYSYVADYEFVSNVSGQEIRLNFEGSTTTFVRHTGVVTKLPKLSEFDIKLPN